MEIPQYGNMALRIQIDRARFMELYKLSVPVAKIAEQMMVDRTTAYKILREDGIVFNPKNGGRKKKAITQGEDGGAIA